MARATVLYTVDESSILPPSTIPSSLPVERLILAQENEVRFLGWEPKNVIIKTRRCRITAIMPLFQSGDLSSILSTCTSPYLLIG